MTDENPPLDDWTEVAPGVHLPPGTRKVSDEKSFDPYERAHAGGAEVGTFHAQLGSNVPMAFFHAGAAAQAVLALRWPDADESQLLASFYDGFTFTYWPLRPDGKEHPYA